MIQRVCVCIPTCMRRDWLSDLLASLAAQVAVPDLAVSFVVVDNDPEGSSRGAVFRFIGEGLPAIYVHEPRRGIAHARNAAVRRALDLGADAVVFIDDDEIPKGDWLLNLVSCQERFNADVVQGGVDPLFEAGAPEWMITGGFFDRPKPPHGHSDFLPVTGNTLILRSVFERVGMFDERFALAGGEDTNFFMRARLAGCTLVFARGADVLERVPRTRANTSWLLRRAFRASNSYVGCERLLYPARHWLLPRTMKAVARLSRGVVRLATALVLGRSVAVRGLQDLASGFGYFSGMFGWRFQEYRTIHGQ